MRIGLGLLLAVAIVGLSSLAKPAVAEDASLVTYEELLDRVARLEEELEEPPGPAGEKAGHACLNGKACGCDTCGDTGGWYTRYENVIVTPYFSRNTAYSEFNDNDIDGVVTNRGFNWDLEYSPRLELGYLDCDGMGWRARYWHFEHSSGIRRQFDGNDVTARPIDDPEIGINISDGTLDAVHGINLQVLDLEAMKQSKDCEGSLTGSFGLRYVRMDQQYTARDIDPASGDLNGFVNLRHNFEGIGPTVSVEALRRFNCSNWGAYVNLRTSILYGEADLVGHADRDPSDPEVDSVTASRNEQDLIPVGEMQIGLDYTRGDWFVRVGLESQYWINGGSASAQAPGDGEDSPTEGDLGFLGLNIATGLSW
jgi:hypothetical protein